MCGDPPRKPLEGSRIGKPLANLLDQCVQVRIGNFAIRVRAFVAPGFRNLRFLRGWLKLFESPRGYFAFCARGHSSGECDISNVLVTPVQSRLQQRQFLALPKALYRNCAQWVPRIRASEKELVHFRNHPFYDDAESIAFLATRDAAPCGRVVALQNRAHDRQHPDESLGFLAFYESEDDAEVAAALFDAAGAWFRRLGIAHMRGPVSPSMNYEAGLLIEGFECAPTFMMPYNAAYYQALWEHHGFEKAHDMFAFSGHRNMLSSLDERIRHIARAARDRFGVQFRQLSRRTFRQDVETFLALYNESSPHTWGFVPLSDGEIRQLSRELRHLIVPELTLMAVIDGTVVGAVFGMLDFNPIVKRIHGRLFPLGFWHILRGKRRLKRTRIMSINVLPEYQRWGLGAALLGQLCNQGLDWGSLEEVEFSYVLESNHLARSSLENGGAKREKTYRVYQKAI